MSESTTGPLMEYVGLVIAILILVLLLIPATTKLWSVFTSESEICKEQDLRSWESLRPILQELDSTKNKKTQFNFIKEDCELVVFSLTQGYKFDLPQTYYSEQPQLCLCNLDSKNCDPYACYKFEKLKEVNQFSSEDLNKVSFINFETKDKILTITHQQ